MKKVILISGGSSGIGCEAARLLASKGHRVYAAARRLERLEPLREQGIIPLQLDVTSTESIISCVNEVMRAEGRIDVLVNNAGYGSLGPVECVTMEEARRQMDTNLFGAAELSKLVVPHMREQDSGRIINISSVAGRACVLYGGWYNISKYAIEALSDNLRIELKSFGIDVSLIEPGGIKTAWGGIAADNLEQSTAGSVYEGTARSEAAMFRKGYGGSFLARPSVVARAIARAALSRHPRVRYHPGTGASALVFFHSLLPARWWDAIMRLPGRL